MVSFANECLTTSPLTVFTQKNSVADFLQANAILHKNRPFCVFETPFGGLRGNVRRSSAHWKAHSGLPLALIELFFARCYGWRATGDIGWKSAISLQQGSVDPKFQVEGFAPPPTILLLRKLGKMFFRMVYKSGQIFLPFCHNTRVWQTDGQTDGRTDRILITIPRLH